MPAVICRSTMFLLALLALSALAAIDSQRAAGATAPVMYVDGAGSCAGNTPCFTTIHDAVELVSAVDTQIRVFPGAYNETVDLDDTADDTGGVYGDLAVISVDSKNVPTPGATVDGGPDPAFFNEDPFNADLRIDGFTVRSQTDGIFVVGDASVTVQRVDSGGAAGDGVNVDAAGDILLDTVFANRSVPVKESPDGFDLQGEGDITVINSQTTNHSGPDDSNGLEIEAHGGNVLVQNTIANFNAGFGIAIESVGPVQVLSSGVEGNGDDGLVVFGNESVLVDFVGARDNGDDGIEITSLGDPEVRNSFAIDNTDSGIQIETEGDVEIANVTIEGNNEPEARVSQQGNPGAIEIREHPESLETSAVDTVTITGSSILNNRGDGVLLLGTGEGTPVTITSNAICQNMGAGLTNLWNTTATATNNWWGDPSGPTTSGNPGGTGDEIPYPNSDYEPWIESVEGEVVTPAAVNQQAEIAFNFTGEGGAELETGLGWPGDIELTTDNGVLDTEVPGQEPNASVIGEITDGTLDATLTAATEGNANIDLKGPCGLDGDLDVPVAGGGLFGDVDCNGAVDTVDALKINRFVAGLDVSQTEPCTDIGSGLSRLAPSGNVAVFGDLNCDGAVTPVDALAVLRHVASLPPLIVPKGCPPIGN